MPNVSSLLEQRALVIPREYGIYGCELGSRITRVKLLDLAEAFGVKEPRLFHPSSLGQVQPPVNRQVGSQQ